MFGSRGLSVVLALLCAASGAHAVVDDVLDVIKLAVEVGEQVFGSWEIIGKQFNLSEGVQLPIMHRMERKVLSKIAEVTRNIERLDLAVDKSMQMTISTLLRRLPENTRLELRINELTDLMARVNNAERQMREYVSRQEEIEKATLEDFATWAVSHEPGAVPGLLERIHTLTAPESQDFLDRGVIKLIVNSMQDSNPDLCNLQQSPHQLLYNMYSTISLTEIKGYAMMQFSWMLLRIYGKGNFTQEASLMRQRYQERTSLTVASIKNAMNNTKREMYRCDPPDHEEGETYLQITRLLQGYVENEVDMNADGTCRENCAFYTLAQNYGCFKDQYCARQATCSGRIINCQYIDSDMWICPASASSNRRYEWIEYENGRTLGRSGSCMRGTSKVDSWWRWNLYHCSYCLCLCEESGELSDRYFSMREVVADSNKNKIVTGLRFIKVGRVIHLQINEGVLRPRATVDQTTTSWQPVEQMDLSSAELKDGVDYHMLTYESRAIDLDELEGPDGHVLTGVRFRMIGAHLHFEIRTTPFNYTSGKLAVEKSEWISNDNTDGADKPRTKLVLNRPDIPTRSHSPSKLDSRHDQYLEFTNTDFDADAAQTTVPFIDAQIVQPTTLVPLTGAGIAHKGLRGSGGFIMPKIFTYNYAKHMHVKVPENEYIVDKDIDFVSGVYKK